MPAEYDHMVRFIPDAPISNDTEMAFIEGVPFVNAAKHEHVVAGLRDAVDAVGVALPAGDRCQNWTPCINTPVVRVGGFDFCARHCPEFSRNEGHRG